MACIRRRADGQIRRGGRTHQRVREPDGGAVDLQQSLPDALVQGDDGVVAQRGGQQRGGGACGDRHHGERLLGGWAQRRDPRGRDPQDAAGQRQRVLVEDPLPAGQSVRPISTAENGFPPQAAWMRRVSRRGSRSP